MKRFAGKRYNAYSIAKIFNKEGKERSYHRMLIMLSKTMPNIHLNKKDNGELEFYYEVKKSE